MKKLKYLCIGILLLFLGGCWGQPSIEQIGATLQLGIEPAPNGRIILTADNPIYGPGGLKNILTSTETDILRQAGLDLQRRQALIPRPGKLEQILFSESLARQGLFPWLDVFTRNTLDPPLASVIVVEGSPKALMEAAQHFKNQPIAALYIHSLMSNNLNQFIPPESIANFILKYYTPGVDPVAPIIKLGVNEISLAGTALFSSDRMVGRLNPTESVLLLALLGKLRGVDYIFHHINAIPGEKSTKSNAAAHVIAMQRKINLQLRKGVPEVTFHLKLSGSLNEYHWDHLTQLQFEHRLERHFAREITRESNRLIRHLQKTGSDPLGVGDLIRADFPAYWKQHNPKQIYQNTRIRVEAKFKILRFGAVK